MELAQQHNQIIDKINTRMNMVKYSHIRQMCLLEEKKAAELSNFKKIEEQYALLLSVEITVEQCDRFFKQIVLSSSIDC